MGNGSNGLKRTLQIGEVAHQTALTVDTIRFYERCELLPAVPRTIGRFRLYRADDLTRLRFIRQMQALGFSLRQIKQLLDLRDRGCYACEDVRDLLKNKLVEIRGKIRHLQKLEIELTNDLRKCNRELNYRKSHAAPGSVLFSRLLLETEEMLIEVLFVPGCPNHKPAVERLRQVLCAQAISAPIQEISVTNEMTARSLKFPGSPTVRINGRDVESNPQHCYGLACRLYSGGTGVPPLEVLQRAIAGAQAEKD